MLRTQIYRATPPAMTALTNFGINPDSTLESRSDFAWRRGTMRYAGQRELVVRDDQGLVPPVGEGRPR
jgi:hypothetical protein